MKENTVLIIDDEPTVLASMTVILSPIYRVQALNSGERVVQVARTTPQPDLILLDVQMPSIDGYQVLEQLKAEPRTRDIPVIFVTGNRASEDEERGLKLGAVDYITKPIMPVTLLARVKNHITLKQARDFLADKTAYLAQEVSRRLAESLTVQDVCIRALAHLAETRDNETGEHILRTQSYVEVLAKHLQHHPDYQDQLSNKKIELITKSAPLHDIGKVGIPDSILLKPARLTTEEREVMETHTILGVQAIEQAEFDVPQSIQFLTTAKEIVRWHHEHWNGNGYPDKLKGTGIPLPARLMAIADVFDALVSRRVYKEPFSLEKSREIILADKGQQFDPNIVDAFEAQFEQFVYIANKYKADASQS